MPKQPRPAAVFPRWWWVLAIFALVMAALYFAFLAPPEKADAAEPTAEPTTDAQVWANYTCLDGWYVNEDETALLPEFVPGQGLLFDGPSILHHQANLKLSDLTAGSFTADAITGALPLLKYETYPPYSTINQTADGTWWSSKISTGPGSQNEPVAAPADLVGKWNYTADTPVVSFGIGYANDQGKEALVKTLTFAGVTYDFVDCPQVGQETETVPATETTTITASTTSDAELPKTGPSGTLLGAGGFTLIFLGVVALLISRGRRSRREG